MDFERFIGAVGIIGAPIALLVGALIGFGVITF